MSFGAKRAPAVVLPLLALVLDRLAKWYAFAALPPERGAVLLPGLKYEYFLNPGLAFSISGPVVAVTVSLLAFMVFAYVAWREHQAGRTLAARTVWSLCLIAFGGLSNIYDRIFSGGVIDYLIFARSAWNIADIMILAGIALLVLKRRPKGGQSAEHDK